MQLLDASGSRITRYQITEMMGHPGLAIADVNGDGLDDLYVCQEQGLPNRLIFATERWDCS